MDSALEPSPIEQKTIKTIRKGQKLKQKKTRLHVTLEVNNTIVNFIAAPLTLVQD